MLNHLCQSAGSVEWVADRYSRFSLASQVAFTANALVAVGASDVT